MSVIEIIWSVEISPLFLRWYRAPELILGAYRYGPAVDVWAVGCIVAELLQRAPIFPGDSDMDQFVRIAQVLGAPNETNWKNHKSLPSPITLKDSFEQIPFEQIFRAVPADMINFLQRTLVYDPTKRCSCEEALQMPVFTTNTPHPSHPSSLPVPKKFKVKASFHSTTIPGKKLKTEHGEAVPSKTSRLK